MRVEGHARRSYPTPGAAWLQSAATSLYPEQGKPDSGSQIEHRRDAWCAMIQANGFRQPGKQPPCAGQAVPTMQLIARDKRLSGPAKKKY
jgi:hypothetical protein